MYLLLHLLLLQLLLLLLLNNLFFCHFTKSLSISSKDLPIFFSILSSPLRIFQFLFLQLLLLHLFFCHFTKSLSISSKDLPSFIVAFLIYLILLQSSLLLPHLVNFPNLSCSHFCNDLKGIKKTII